MPQTRKQLILAKTAPTHNLEPFMDFVSLEVWNPVDVPVKFAIHARGVLREEPYEQRLIETVILPGKRYRLDAITGQELRRQQSWGSVIEFRMTNQTGICQVTFVYEELNKYAVFAPWLVRVVR